MDNRLQMNAIPQKTPEAALLKAALAASEAALGLHWKVLNAPAGGQKRPQTRGWNCVMRARH